MSVRRRVWLASLLALGILGSSLTWVRGETGPGAPTPPDPPGAEAAGDGAQAEGNGATAAGDGAAAAGSSAAAAGDILDFRSNRFTAPEVDLPQAPPPRAVPPGYRRVAESPALELYVAPDGSGIAVRDQRTGYVWASTPPEEDLAQADLNAFWDAALRSPFLVEYFDASSQLTRGSLLSLGGRLAELETTGSGFRAVYTMPEVELGLTLEVTLEGDELVVRIPNEDLVEGKAARWAAVQPFPFLGAVREASVPGYLLIPDGSGALIRFRETVRRYDEPYRGKVYGLDPAFEESNVPWWLREPEPVTMPVFGIVHGARHSGFLAILEAGKYQAEIIASPSGVNTPFYWAGARFILRQPYYQPTSKNLGGFYTYQRERNREDLQVRYRFLAGDDAHYAGMARAYREYLRRTGQLPARPLEPGPIPLRLEVLAAEREPGLIGSRTVKMTAFDEAAEMVEELRALGVERMMVVVQGWNRGGLHYSSPDRFPVEKVIGGEEGLRRLAARLSGYGYPLYLTADYFLAYGRNRSFLPRRDAVRKASNELLQTTLWAASTEEHIEAYYIRPAKAAELMAADGERFRALGVSGVALAGIGEGLTSDYAGAQPTGRTEAARLYREAAAALKGQVGSLAWYRPNEYLLPYADHILDIPMYSSQYMYATDTVPFVQMVLHGAVEYFAPYMNVSASPREYLLRMVEYGAYPSYLLTYEPSWKLRRTLSDWLFTSHFPDWKEDAAQVWQRVNAALSRVRGVPVADRRVRDWGVVEMVYENGVHIAVNYRAEAVQVDGRQVPGRDFVVWEGGTR